MNSKIKYHLIMIGTAALFIYVLATQLTDRGRMIISEWRDLKEQKAMVLDPQALVEKKKGLLLKKQNLTTSLMEDAGGYEQRQTGVVEFLHSSAEKYNIALESLSPHSVRSNELSEEILFTISLRSGYHNLGLLINALETASMAVRLRRLSIARMEEDGQLHIDMEGSGFIFPHDEQQ